MDAQVAPEALDRIILQIAIAAEQLQRVVDDLAAIVGREPLCHRREARLVGGVRGDFCRRHVKQGARGFEVGRHVRSEEHTSELQSLMRISYAVFCWKKKNTKQ